MTDQKFKYTTSDGERHELDISFLHLAQTELEMNVSALEWSLMIEPHLVAAHKAWVDMSVKNRAHFLAWCEDIVSVDGQRSYASKYDEDEVEVPYKVFVDAERFFNKHFVDLMVNNTLTLRLFVVWKVFHPDSKDFYQWLEYLPTNFECDFRTENTGGDANPKD